MHHWISAKRISETTRSRKSVSTEKSCKIKPDQNYKEFVQRTRFCLYNSKEQHAAASLEGKYECELGYISTNFNTFRILTIAFSFSCPASAYNCAKSDTVI